MAMSLFGVGFRKVWLDPTKANVIAKAKTRTIFGI
jgi:ribosomal protein L19E